LGPANVVGSGASDIGNDALQGCFVVYAVSREDLLQQLERVILRQNAMYFEEFVESTIGHG
jgi:hypothetical protein